MQRTLAVSTKIFIVVWKIFRKCYFRENASKKYSTAMDNPKISMIFLKVFREIEF